MPQRDELRKPPAPDLPAAPRYPAVDPGLPAVDVSAILRSQHGLLERLRRVAGFDAAGFDRHCLAPVERLARYIHLLPASSFEHFAGPGGLFRYCLELGVCTRQAADARFFAPAASAEARQGLELRWRHACFLAGLLSEAHRPLSSMVVTDEGGRAWPAYLGSLDAWLQAGGIDHYHVSWQASAVAVAVDGAEGAAVLGDIIPKESLVWLNEASSQLVREVFATALGQPGMSRSELSDLVTATRQRVLATDLALRPSRYGQLRIGHHLELHLLDALRHRVASGQWAPGGATGPLWYGIDGLFLEWPSSAEALRHDAARNGVRGWPLCAFTVAEVLGRAGLLAEASPGQWLWRVQVGGASAGEAGVRTALKLAEPAAVLGYERVVPLPVHLVARSAAGLLRSMPAPGSGFQPETGSPLLPQSQPQLQPKPPPCQPPSASPLARAESDARDALAGLPQAAGQAPSSAAHVVRHAMLHQTEPPPGASASQHAPASRATLADTLVSPEDAALFDVWWRCLRGRQHHLIAPLGARGVAVSQELLMHCGADLVDVATRLHDRRWLGRGDWPQAEARAGLLPFDGVHKPGLVLNPAALRQLGWPPAG